MATLQLSNLAPDFDGLVAQLQNYLSTKESWKGMLTTQTGQTIIEMIAAVGALDQTKLIRYAQDGFPSTAMSNAAIYAGLVGQGVRISRKAAARIQATIVSSDYRVLPAFTQFQGGGASWATLQAYSIGPTPTPITLFEGSVTHAIASGTGNNYQMFISAEENFQVDDQSVMAYLDGQLIQKTFNGLWELAQTQGFRDRTLPDGRLIVEFGNDNYGAKPSTNQIVDLYYLVTSGASGNGLTLVGKKLAMTDDPTVTAIATSDSSGGADQTQPFVYKNMDAGNFGNFGSAVNKQQYQKLVTSYPGVVDAIVQSQREVNPYSVQMMNVIKVTPLTTTTWSTQQKAQYIDYLQTGSMFAPRFIIADPVKITVDVSATIYCFSWANSSQAIADGLEAVRNLFALRPGMLGYDITTFDIADAIKKSNKGIDYVKLNTPVLDSIASNTPLDAPFLSGVPATVGGPSLITSGGTTFYYSVSYFNSLGEVLPVNWASVTLSSNTRSTVRLNWGAVQGATGYRIWGRQLNKIDNFYSLIATTTTNTFLDTGYDTFPPQKDVPVPNQGTMPVRYNSLGNLAINARVTSRVLRNG